MRIPRVYFPTTLQTNTTVELDARATTHLKDVLRLKVGYKVVLFNGDGYDYAGEVNRLDKKSILIDLHSSIKIENESPLSIHLLQPVSRAEKMDWCIQKATELGANKISPVICQRSNVKYDDKKIEKKLSHWRSVITSACEQSGRAVVPTINIPVSYSEAISQNFGETDFKIVTSPVAQQSFTDIKDANTSCCICAIGPEGGLTEEEISLAENQGYHAMSLGPRILRLETAVIATLSILQSQWGDLKR